MSGGGFDEALVGIVVISLLLAVAMVIGAPFVVLHGYELIGSGRTVAGWLYVLLGVLLLSPVVFLIWSGFRKALRYLGRRRP